MVLTTVLLAVSTVAVPVENGTWSPTCKVADWLSSTTSDGLDSTLTLVMPCSASRTTRGEFSDPIRKLKPGSTRPSSAPAAALTALLAASTPVLLGETPLIVLEIEPFWLARKNCTP